MEQEQTYKWVQERLRQLHSGTLSDADRLRLMDIAAHDPFVADALEGYSAHPEDEHAEYLEYLAGKIAHRKRERRKWLMPNLTITAIAASLLIVIATYAVITRIEHKDQQTTFVFVSPDSLQTHESASDGVAMEQPVPEDTSPSAMAVTSATPAAPVPDRKSKAKEQTTQTTPPSPQPSGAVASKAQVDSEASDAAVISTEPNWPEGFVNYLTANSKYPIAKNGDASPKRVTFGFYIDQHGNVYRVESMKSYAPDNYKAEALRLLKNSTGWTCSDGSYSCKLECTISFR